MKLLSVLALSSSIFLFSCGSKSYCDCKKEMDQLSIDLEKNGESEELTKKLTTWGEECKKEYDTASIKEKLECN